VSAIITVLSTNRCLVPVTSIQSDSATVADLARTGAGVLIADAEDWNRGDLLEGCRQLGVLGLLITESGAERVADSGAGPEIASAPGVAVLMPTSGTTGLPKRIPYTYAQLGGALGRVAAYSPATRRSLGGPLRLRRRRPPEATRFSRQKSKC